MLLIISLPLGSRPYLNYHLFQLLQFYLLLFCIQIIGYLISREIFDTILLNLCLKSYFYLISGLIIGYIFHKCGFDRSRSIRILVSIFVLIGFLNSIIVLLEWTSPVLKASIESILYHHPDMNIDYSKNEFRIRGLASVGGAGLSVFHALILLSGFWLYIQRIIGLTWLIILFFVIGGSIFFIGRSGFYLLATGITFMTLIFGGKQPKQILYILILFFILIGALLKYVDIFPEYVRIHSINLIFGGFDGLNEEGTIDILKSFYHLPNNFSQNLIGIGNFSGSFISGEATDPGFMKMLTAVGFVGASFFYSTLIIFAKKVISRSNCNYDEKFYIYFMFLSLFIMELKEPFLLQGYSSRALFMLLGLLLSYFYSNKIKNSGGFSIIK
jgi:hypothetical protein